ncbi:unnamed protein product, partial [Callosobruchus maculatus]
SSSAYLAVKRRSSPVRRHFTSSVAPRVSCDAAFSVGQPRSISGSRTSVRFSSSARGKSTPPGTPRRRDSSVFVVPPVSSLDLWSYPLDRDHDKDCFFYVIGIVLVLRTPGAINSIRKHQKMNRR